MWNIYSYSYDSIARLHVYRELMDKTCNNFDFEGEEGVIIIDVGCGTGNLLLDLKSRNKLWRFYGFDGSPPMLARAGKKNLGKIFVRGNIDDGLPLAGSSLDGIAMINVLYAAASPAKTIRECHRVLKFDGILVVANPVKGAKITSVVSFREIMSNPRFWPSVLINVFIKLMNRNKIFHFMEPEQLSELLCTSGFQIISSEPVYGNTDILIKARKILIFEASGGEVSAAIAHTDEDIKAVRRLRFDVYCNELKSLDPADYPEKEEYDQFDEHSSTIILKRSQELIGTMRMVKDSCLGFVMDSSFELPSGLDRSKVVEYSRAIIKPVHRRGRTYKFLLSAAQEWQKERGYTVSISAAQLGSVDKILESEGWSYIGEPKSYHNTVSVPMMYQLAVN